MEPIIITIWAVGVVVAVGGAITMALISRSKWKKLPSLNTIEAKGPGPSLALQEEAIAFFVTRWPEQVNFRGLRIEWRRGQWFYVGNKKASGKTMNRDYIVCANVDGILVLFHELVHIFFWREDDNPDLHHRQQKYWDLMYDIQREWVERDAKPEIQRWQS